MRRRIVAGLASLALAVGLGISTAAPAAAGREWEKSTACSRDAPGIASGKLFTSVNRLRGSTISRSSRQYLRYAQTNVNASYPGVRRVKVAVWVSGYGFQGSQYMYRGGVGNFTHPLGFSVYKGAPVRVVVTAYYGYNSARSCTYGWTAQPGRYL